MVFRLDDDGMPDAYREKSHHGNDDASKVHSLSFWVQRYTFSRITVHSTQNKIHAEIRDEDGEEADDHVKMVYAGLTEEGDGSLVEGYGIDHERDECPRLLRVPRPVVAPRHVGPDGTEEDADGEEEDGRIEEELGKSGCSF